jgi:hypothetical protein
MRSSLTHSLSVLAAPDRLRPLSSWNAWLGDWTSMTAAERKVINRAVMFYPFVRYSTRLLFYTLPVDHPAITGVIAELGALTAEEYREIFGDDDLPWNLGKVYFGETGEAEMIDLGRANPLTNSLVSGAARIGTGSSNLPGAAIGMLPPYAQWLIDHATGRSSFADRPYRVDRDTSPFPKKAHEISLPAHGRIALRQALSLFYPYREAEDRLVDGPQGDDSVFGSHPLDYKTEAEITGGGLSNEIRRRNAREAAANEAHRKANQGGIADVVLGPLVPRKTRDAAASRARREIAALRAEQECRAAEPGRHTTRKPTLRKSGGGSLTLRKSTRRTTLKKGR